jgi:hypothetical protein
MFTRMGASSARALDEREHVARREERAEEVGRGAGHGGLREELQEAVEAEDEEREAEGDAGDGGELVHGGHLGLVERVT